MYSEPPTEVNHSCLRTPFCGFSSVGLCRYSSHRKPCLRCSGAALMVDFLTGVIVGFVVGMLIAPLINALAPKFQAHMLARKLERFFEDLS